MRNLVPEDQPLSFAPLFSLSPQSSTAKEQRVANVSICSYDPVIIASL
jgi:hypothetical protein